MSEELNQQQQTEVAIGATHSSDGKQDRDHSPLERSQHSTTPSPTAISSKPTLRQAGNPNTNNSDVVGEIGQAAAAPTTTQSPATENLVYQSYSNKASAEEETKDEKDVGAKPQQQQQQPVVVKEVLYQPEDNEEGDFEDTMGDEEEEDEEYEEDEDDEIDDDQKVVESSPKGRFKRFKEELGRGAYKIVYKGVDHETGLEVAWNSISLLKLPQSDRVRIKKEIDLIKNLKHENIIHFITGWQNKEKQEVIFITEITSGTLRRYIKKNKITKLRVIKGWCQSILAGLVYLHEQPLPIIHRDLKCDNIFINSNSGEIRIGDLGLSTPMNNSYTSSVLGTPEFMAPELYEEHYDCKVDIYAFGMCMLEMITQSLPYNECLSAAQIYKKVTAGEPPLALSRIKDSEVHDFISRCLHADKTQRPTARELLESSFIQTLDDEMSKEAVKLGPAIRRNHHHKNRKSCLAQQDNIIPEVEEEHSDTEEHFSKKQTAAADAQAQPTPLQKQAAQAQQDKSGAISQQENAPVVVKTGQDDPNQTMQAARMQSIIQEIHAEEQDDIILKPQTIVQTVVVAPQKSGTNTINGKELKVATIAAPQQNQNLAIPPPQQQVAPISPMLAVPTLQSSKSVNLGPVGPGNGQVSTNKDTTSEDGITMQNNNNRQSNDACENDDFRRTNTEQTEQCNRRGGGNLLTLDQFAASAGDGSSEKTSSVTPKAFKNNSFFNKTGSAERHHEQKVAEVEPEEVALQPHDSDVMREKGATESFATLMGGGGSAGLDKLQVPQNTTMNNEALGVLGLRQSSEGNQSQSSGITFRKLTDVGNPDCTFSDPKFGQEAEELQSHTSRGDPNQTNNGSPIEPYLVQSFTGLAATNAEGGGSATHVNHRRNRLESHEACFGGSDDDNSDKNAYEAQYTSDFDDSKEEEYSDDDQKKERELERLNESVQMLNEMDRKKHERMMKQQLPGENENGVTILEELTQQIINDDELERRASGGHGSHTTTDRAKLGNQQAFHSNSSQKPKKGTVKKRQSRQREQTTKRQNSQALSYNSQQNGLMPCRSQSVNLIAPQTSSSMIAQQNQMTQVPQSNLSQVNTAGAQQSQQSQVQQQLASLAKQSEHKKNTPQLNKNFIEDDIIGAQAVFDKVVTNNAASSIQQQSQKAQQSASTNVLINAASAAPGGKKPPSNENKSDTNVASSHVKANTRKQQTGTANQMTRQFSQSTSNNNGMLTHSDHVTQDDDDHSDEFDEQHSSSQSESSDSSEERDQACGNGFAVTQHRHGRTQHQQQVGHNGGDNNRGRGVQASMSQRQIITSKKEILAHHSKQSLSSSNLMQVVSGGRSSLSATTSTVDQASQQSAVASQNYHMGQKQALQGGVPPSKTSQQQVQSQSQGVGAPPPSSTTNTTSTTTTTEKRHSKSNISKQQERSHQQQQQRLSNTLTPSGSGETWTVVCGKGEHNTKNVTTGAGGGGATEKQSSSKHTNAAKEKSQQHLSSSSQQQSHQADYQTTSCKECAAAAKVNVQQQTQQPQQVQSQQQPPQAQQQQQQSRADERPLREKRRLDKARSSSNVHVSNRNESANRQQTTPKIQQRKNEHVLPAQRSGGNTQQASTAPLQAEQTMSTGTNLISQQQQLQDPSRQQTNPSGPAANSSASGIVSSCKRASKNSISIKITLPQDYGRNPITAAFNFNTIEDTAHGVANEMVKELHLNPSFKRQIENEIDENVRWLHEQERDKQDQLSHPPATQKRSIIEQQQQAVSNRDIDRQLNKHLKHHFRKLQGHLDAFFIEMKQAGLLNNDEIQRAFEMLYPISQVSSSQAAKRKDTIEVLAKMNKSIKQSHNSATQSSRQQASSTLKSSTTTTTTTAADEGSHTHHVASSQVTPGGQLQQSSGNVNIPERPSSKMNKINQVQQSQE